MRKLAMAVVSTALTLTAVSGAQAAAHRGNSPPPDPTTVTVENELSSSVVIYAEHGEFDVRLGAVPGASSTVFEIPAWMIRPRTTLTIFVRPAKGLEQSSGSLEIRQGEHLKLIVPGHGPAVAKPAAVPERPGEPTTVTVENDLATTVRVYAEHGNVDVRLGTVAARSSTTYQIPSWMIGLEDTVNIYVRPERGAEQDTGPLELRRGEHLGVKVPHR